MALLIMGLHLGRAVQMALIVRKWPVMGKDPSLVNRLRRFLDNHRIEVRSWYRPLALHLVEQFAGKRIRLVIDCTKVGFNYRLMTISLAYKRRTLPLKVVIATIKVAPIIIGMCRLTTLDCTVIAAMRPVTPNIRPILAMLEPITLPRAIPFAPRHATRALTSSSGADVPMATTVSPMVSGVRPYQVALAADARFTSTGRSPQV
jgi:hypothetical protein